VTVALAEVRAWLQVPVSTLSDPQLQQVLDAETLLQARACRLPEDGTLTPDLIQAVYRRVGREVAARGVPLGMLGADSEYGPSRLSRWDSEIDRLEGPNRVVVFG
jgi:hypothetical protein